MAERVANHVAALPQRLFVAVRDVDGSRSAVESAFSRLAAAGDILRVRKGLYWKGATTALGMSPPRVEEVALKLGGPGSGPAGVAAAHWLGLHRRCLRHIWPQCLSGHRDPGRGCVSHSAQSIGCSIR